MGKSLRDLLLCPMILGAVYVSLLAVWAGQADRPPGAELGARAQELWTFIEGHFGSEIRRFAVRILLFAAGVGAMIGALAGLVVGLRHRLARVSRHAHFPPRRWYAVALESLGVIAVMHAVSIGWGMAHAPALYATSFYAKGGVRRLVQIVVSDGLGPAGVAFVATLLGAAYLAGPPKQWRAWSARLRQVRLPRTWTGAWRRAGIVALASMVAGIAWCSFRPHAVAAPPDSRESARAEPPVNVLILAADSLRFDRLNPKIMPHISAFSERATVFERAYVSVPRTFPSWVSMLTGRHPHHHGIDTMFPRWEDRDKDFAAVPAQFARQGYRTLVVSDFVGDIFGRIDLGFSDVRTPSFDFVELLRSRGIAREVPLMPMLHTAIGRRFFPVMRELEMGADPDLFVNEVHRALGDIPPGEPFFATVFLGTTHFPYAAPAPYHRRFTAPEYRGRFKYHRPLALESDVMVGAEDAAHIRNLYDGAVASVDDAFGRILGELEARRVADRTIVVLLADHGEELHDSGRGPGHGDLLFGDEGTHIPLIIFDPRAASGQRERRVVRDVDLAPTLYELAHIAPPAKVTLDGRSLAAALTGKDMGKELAPALAYAETEVWFGEDIPTLSPSGLRLPYPGIDLITEVDEAHHQEIVLQKRMRPIVVTAKHRMVRDERFKLVYVPTRMGAKYMLYDTQADPAEEHDVAARYPEELARLTAALRAYILEDPSLTFRNGMAVPREPEVPYNVLWIAVDGLQPDAKAAQTPALEDLARTGVQFAQAHAAAISPRPATLALLSGARPSELGAEPPWLARILRKHGVRTGAVVNHPLLTGSAPDGLDMGFETVLEHRERASATSAITRDAASFIRESTGAPFFLFCNYGAEAPTGALELLRTLDEAHQRARTLVIVTSARSETSHIPLILALPGVLPAGKVVDARVRSIDLAPTVLDALGIEPPSAMSGRSMLALTRDAPEPDERPVLTEGRGSRALLAGRYRLLVRGKSEALFDVAADPAEKTNLAAARPDVVAEMRARLAAAEKNVAPVGSTEARPEAPPIHLRFAGAGAAHRIQGQIRAASAATPAGPRTPTFRIEPDGIALESFKIEPSDPSKPADPARVEFAFSTAPNGPVGFDLRVEPADAPLVWELYLDDRPWPAERFFAGPLGITEPSLVHGIDTDEARASIASPEIPTIDAARDLGLFVTRAARGSFSGVK